MGLDGIGEVGDRASERAVFKSCEIALKGSAFFIPHH
jgi:hypothetical protein